MYQAAIRRAQLRRECPAFEERITPKYLCATFYPISEQSRATLRRFFGSVSLCTESTKPIEMMRMTALPRRREVAAQPIRKGDARAEYEAKVRSGLSRYALIIGLYRRADNDGQSANHVVEA